MSAGGFVGADTVVVAGVVVVVVAVVEVVEVGIGVAALGVTALAGDASVSTLEFIDVAIDGKYIGFENDVVRRKAERFRPELVGARAAFDPAWQRISLALFVEGHDHRSGAVAMDELGSFNKRGFALF